MLCYSGPLRKVVYPTAGLAAGAYDGGARLRS